MAWWHRGMDLLPRPLDTVGSIKLKLGLLLLGSGAAGGCVLWYGLGMMPPKTTATAAIVALATSQILAHGMTSPLREMTAAAGAMARGDYSVRVTATSHDEVGQLAEAFNRMAGDLAAADRQRRELIANVSHELRTPVTALRAMLENLADGVATPGPAELNAAVAQTERLGRLVSDLLDVSRLDAGVTPLDRSHFDVESFLSDAIAEATFHTDVDTRVDVPSGLIGYADVDRLHQVLANLLANAARYNKPGGTVTVSARLDGDRLVIEVADEGPGIAAADRDRVFERFARARGDERTGTGLGLAIARWIVELHSGHIGVADGGTGCVIRISLPHIQEETMSESISPPVTPWPPAPRPVGEPRVIGFGRWWPGTPAAAPRLALWGALAVAILTATALVNTDGVGLGFGLAGVGMLAVPLALVRDGQWPIRCVGAAAVVALWSVAVVRDGTWISLPCALAGAALTAAVLAPPRRFTGLLLATAGSPLLGLGGAALWLRRGIPRLFGGERSGGRNLRVAGISAGLLLVFGALFASADAAFAGLLGTLLPPMNAGILIGRICVIAMVFFGIGVWGYIAVTRPRFDTADDATPRPASRTEWIIPLAVLNALFAGFLAVQATAFFGGDSYVRHTAGLTYAQYARSGFWQLSAVSVLTLAVLAVAVWKAPRGTRTDRVLMRALLGALCVMSLVVVGSALHRMQLYSEVYGLTRLRLAVFAAELCFAAIFVAVIACGVTLRAGWLPRAVLGCGIATVLGFAAINPDAVIAQRNVDLAAETGRIDLYYLSSLSADAVPAFDALPAGQRDCLNWLADWDLHDDPLSWNLGRDRAAAVAADWPTPSEASCPDM